MDNSSDTTKDDSADFSLEPVQLQFALKSTIKRMLVSNNLLHIILENGLIYRIDLDNPETVEQVDLNLGANTVKNAFIDVNGYHLIVQTNKDAFYYLHKSSKHPRELTKLRGFPITSIRFMELHVTRKSTGPMLVSMLSGALYEVCIESKKEKVVKQIWKAKAGIINLCSVYTIDYKAGSVNYTVLCSLTNNRIVQLKYNLPKVVSNSKPCLQAAMKKDTVSFNFNSVIKLTCNGNIFAFLDVSEEDSSYQVTFGNVRFKSKKRLHHIKLNSETGSLISQIMLTKYYIILITTNHEMVILNQLNGLEISRQELGTDSSNLGWSLAQDLKYGTYWMYSGSSIYEVVINNENAGIWKLMTDRKMFDEAVATLDDPKGSDSQKYNLIMIAKGRSLLSKKNYMNAAKVLAETDEPLDKVSIVFTNAQEQNSLRVYLESKLRHTPKYTKMQKSILSSWLVELYMEGLNDLDKQMASKSDEADTKNQAKFAEKKESYLRDFHAFLQNFKDQLDKETVYQLILSHNRKQELLYFANLIGDSEFVLKYYLNLQKWDESLKVLTLQNEPHLVYTSAMLLFVNYPVKTCDTWIRLIDTLEYTKLLPALLAYDRTVVKSRGISVHHNQALRFLQFLIDDRKVRDKIIHNIYLSMLIWDSDKDSESLILKYFESCNTDKNYFTGNFDIQFDLVFILRLASRYRRIKTSVYVYSMMGDPDSAIALALKHDEVELAILVAEKASTDSSTTVKRLWLKIASHLISRSLADIKYLGQHLKYFEVADKLNNQKMQIQKLLHFLSTKCESLTMKDLLPLFPDFVVIDNFKEEIVKSLQSLSLEMTDLSDEMESSLSQEKKIKKRIGDFKEDSIQIVEPYESCMICHKILTTRKFFTFPCSHSFHQDCLVKKILSSNNYKLKSEVYSLQKKLIASVGDNKQLAKIKDQIDEALSRRCCLCTDMIINEIEQPLVAANDKEAAKWAI